MVDKSNGWRWWWTLELPPNVKVPVPFKSVLDIRSYIYLLVSKILELRLLWCKYTWVNLFELWSERRDLWPILEGGREREEWGAWRGVELKSHFTFTGRCTQKKQQRPRKASILQIAVNDCQDYTFCERKIAKMSMSSSWYRGQCHSITHDHDGYCSTSFCFCSWN